VGLDTKAKEGRRQCHVRRPRPPGQPRPARRHPPRNRPPRRNNPPPTGLPVLDEALGGGLPRGRITELAGPRSTGRTGLACAIAARATTAGETIAWIDPADALDPDAAAKAGLELTHTLWVRPRSTEDALRAAEIVLGAGGFGLVVLDTDATRSGAGRWPRLARAAERTRSTLLVVAPRRDAGTFAALGLELTARRVRWSGGPEEGLGRLVPSSRASTRASRSPGAGRASRADARREAGVRLNARCRASPASSFPISLSPPPAAPIRTSPDCRSR
jgi:hypothetical protein